MVRKKTPIRHAEIVELFAAKLREVRLSRGLTQAALAMAAGVTTTYIGRLESAGAAPGIDLVDRLSKALGTTVNDLLPATAPADTVAVLREQAKGLFESLIQAADREMLLIVCPLLARLNESMNRSR